MDNDPTDICFYEWFTYSVRKTRDCARGVRSYARERVERGYVFWNCAVMFFYNALSRLPKIERAPVVTHAAPYGKDVSQGSFREGFDGGICSQEFRVFYKHARYLCLLKHNF